MGTISHLFRLEQNVLFLHYLLFDQEEYFSVKSSLMFIFHIVIVLLKITQLRYYEIVKRTFELH